MPGCQALAGALSNGALPKLESLFLASNSIGDVGVTALATAVGQRGAPQTRETLAWARTPSATSGVTALADRGGERGAGFLPGALPALEPDWGRRSLCARFGLRQRGAPSPPNSGARRQQDWRCGPHSPRRCVCQWALAQLTTLSFWGNQIGDAGISSSRSRGGERGPGVSQEDLCRHREPPTACCCLPASWHCDYLRMPWVCAVLSV